MFRRFNERPFTEKAIRILTVISLVVGIPVAIKTLWDKDDADKISTSGNNSPVINGDGNTINNNTYNSNTSITPLKPSTDNKVSSKATSKNADLDKASMATEIVDNNKINIAILPFENLSENTNYGWLSKGLAESLLEPLSSVEKYIVLEGTLRDKVIGEINFQQGKYVDVASAVKIGKLLGAENILIGSYQINDNHIRITTRIIDVEEGKVLDKSITTFDGSTNRPFQMQKDFSTQFIKKLYE